MHKALRVFLALPVFLTSARAELIGHWDFEGDTTSTSAPDQSGNDNVGLLLGNAFISRNESPAVGVGYLLLENGVTGGGGSAMSINHTADGMLLSELPTFSVSMWARSAVGSRQLDRRIFSEASSIDSNPLYNLGTGSSGSGAALDLFRRTTAAGGGISHTLSETTPFADGEWHHYLITDNSGTVEVHIDGVLAIQATYTDAPFNGNTTSFGAIIRDEFDNGFTGDMDEISIFDSILTGNQIRALTAKIAPATINDTDTNSNGLPDYWEAQFGISDANGNNDADSLTNLEEFNAGTDPTLADSDGDTLNDDVELTNRTNPRLADTDNDGLDDAGEITAGTNPFDTDSDDDTLLDGYEVANNLDPLDNGLNPNQLGEVGNPGNGIGGDPDMDNLTNAQEFAAGTRPDIPDTDMDGLTDGDELNNLDLNPLNDDSDNDTILDGEEVIAGADTFITDPKSADTDFDGISDPDEILNGSDPTNSNDPNPIPAIPTEGLVHLWKFDDAQGTTASDSIGNANAEWNGSPENLTFITQGLIGGAANVEGDAGGGQRLNVPSTLAIDGSSAFTISMWYQNDGNADQAYNGLFMSRSTGDPSFNWGIAVRDLEGVRERRLDFRIANRGGGSAGNAIELPIPNDPDVWHHTALSYSFSDEGVIITAALDGVITAFQTNGNAASTVDGTGWSIAGDGNQDVRDFDGRFDELAVYNIALNEDQIISLYRNGLAGNSIPPATTEPSSPDFRISDFAFNEDGTITVTWVSDLDTSVNYELIGTTDLSAPNSEWSVLGTTTASGDTTTTFTTATSIITNETRYFVAIRQVSSI